jgi:alcohol dehydrogenase, propanol-preferring
MVETMKAAVLTAPHTPLEIQNLPIPEPGEKQVLIRVLACGVCRTDLHIFRGELDNPTLPLVMGHQIVGEIVKLGAGVKKWKLHQLVGIPWLGHTCGQCTFCKKNKENLCDHAAFTGYTLQGGFAEYTIASSDFIFSIPKGLPPQKCAPLFCPGFIGLRALKFISEAQTIGFYGFGASARILIRIALHQKREVYVFTRPGDIESQEEAKKAGASWVGGSDESPPNHIDAALIFAPVGDLVPKALKDVKKGGKVVCTGIHMSDIPSFPYSNLWEERTLTSVANLTRQDGIDLLSLAYQLKITPSTTSYPLEKINEALLDMESGKVHGSPLILLR